MYSEYSRVVQYVSLVKNWGTQIYTVHVVYSPSVDANPGRKRLPQYSIQRAQSSLLHRMKTNTKGEV